MDRTKAPNWADIGGGRRGYRDKDLANGIWGTGLIAADRNAVQEEIMAVIEAAGLVPDVNDWTQLLRALRILSGGSIQVYATPGSYTHTVPAWAKRLRVRLCGGGGGGGGSSASAAAGGGGAGGYAEGVVSVTPGQTIPVIVGAGGVGGAAGLPGTAGGTSSFGTFLSATGGGTARLVVSGVPITGGEPGQGTGGAIALQGGYGAEGSNAASCPGGHGGASYFGGGGNGGFPTGIAGRAPGSGGGGGWSNGNNTGGNGAPGIVIVEPLP